MQTKRDAHDAEMKKILRLNNMINAKNKRLENMQKQRCMEK